MSSGSPSPASMQARSPEGRRRLRRRGRVVFVGVWRDHAPAESVSSGGGGPGRGRAPPLRRVDARGPFWLGPRPWGSCVRACVYVCVSGDGQASGPPAHLRVQVVPGPLPARAHRPLSDWDFRTPTSLWGLGSLGVLDGSGARSPTARGRRPLPPRPRPCPRPAPRTLSSAPRAPTHGRAAL